MGQMISIKQDTTGDTECKQISETAESAHSQVKYLEPQVTSIFNDDHPKNLSTDFHPLTRLTQELICVRCSPETMTERNGGDATAGDKKEVERRTSKLLPEKMSPDQCFCLYQAPVAGDFGAFYQGYETHTWKKLTFKIFKAKFFHNKPSALEKQIMGLSRKPYTIPDLIATFKFQMQNCLVLEPLSTDSLKEKMRFCRRFPEDVVLFYMSEIVLAVSYLHSKGLVHRNLTPEVFWVQPNGHLKLVDFTKCVYNNKMWRNFLGFRNFIEYTAPELLSYRFCTKEVDTWAVGVIFYRMFTGMMPFYGHTKKDLVRKIKSGLVQYGDRFTPDGLDLCQQLLEKNPKNRLGYKKNTHLSFSSHPYFSEVNWDQVSSGSMEAPTIPLLLSAVRNQGIQSLRLNLTRYSDVKMKVKPLLLKQIVTGEGMELFDQELMELKHAQKIKKYKNKKNLNLAKVFHKGRPKYSFMKVLSKTDISSKQTSDNHGEKSSLTSSESSEEVLDPPRDLLPYWCNNNYPFSSRMAPSVLRKRLEMYIFTHLGAMEEKIDRKGVPMAAALLEFQSTVNAALDEMQELIKSETTPRSTPIPTPTLLPCPVRSKSK